MRDIGRPPGEPPGEEIELEWRDDDKGHCASCGRDVADEIADQIADWIEEAVQTYNAECPHCGCDVVAQFKVTVKVTDFQTQVTVLFHEDSNDAYDYLADR